MLGPVTYPSSIPALLLRCEGSDCLTMDDARRGSVQAVFPAWHGSEECRPWLPSP